MTTTSADDRMTGTPDQRLAAAVTELLARRNGTSRVSGNYGTRRLGTNGWHVDDPTERRPCCAQATRYGSLGIRAHLRGVTHVAHLYGVDETALRAAAQAVHSPAV